MSDGIKASAKGDKTVYLQVGAWYDEDTGHIHLSVPRSKWFVTTVNATEGSKRCHANLYRKLARALHEAGVPAPHIDAGAETADD